MTERLQIRTISLRRIPFLISILLLILSACASSIPGIPVTGNDQTQTPTIESRLANTSWKLMSYGPHDAQAQVIQGTEVTLQFNDGSAAGSGGCNSFGAKYGLISNYRLRIHDIVSTERACTAQGLMDQEQEYFEALRAAGRFELSDDSLTIWYSGEQGALHFSRPRSSTPVQPMGTATSIVPTTVNLTATSVNANLAQRISFAPGSTRAIIRGQLAASTSDQYVLRTLAGQTMSVDLAFSEGRAILVIWGADGNVLLSDHAEVSSFQRVLPTTQDYFILVKGLPEGNTTYTMTVTIPATGAGSERIEFASEATSATVAGQLNSYESDQYVLHAMAGQTMKIKFDFTEGRANLVIWGANGNVLLSDHPQTSEFQGVLPSTQDYYIQVKGWPDGKTTYKMTVTILPLPYP